MANLPFSPKLSSLGDKKIARKPEKGAFFLDFLAVRTLQPVEEGVWTSNALAKTLKSWKETKVQTPFSTGCQWTKFVRLRLPR
jgi:hypothetical protein